MNAENAVPGCLVLDDSSEGHPLEQVVQLLENTVWLVDVLVEALSTFLTETKVAIYIPILVISTHKEDLTWILQL